ncbi:hypothetical protein C8A05DRAFT_37322 [Staphylotrichum tortipilum]|uniref:Uncharacterized protein n=1 Tax=Staphylotrichum tortipilum TaxID=2831512 RepID=A0AAN6MDX7_9PEZI|nr:hypothetical protein C8A05DRAFT_37322 [Staphylotrichum longicolle]
MFLTTTARHKSFVAFHALDYVAHARQSLPTTLCAHFPAAPLPCPAHIWEAPTAEEWARQHRVWEEVYPSAGDGGPLRERDLLCWMQGRESRREEQLLEVQRCDA